LARDLGILRILVVINKMDCTFWDEVLYEEMLSSLKPAVLSKTRHHVPVLPISALCGDNVRQVVDPLRCSWYRGESLTTTLDSMSIYLEKYEKNPLRMVVLNSFSDSDGEYLVGQVNSGTISTGDEVIIMPKKVQATVVQLETNLGLITQTIAGNNVTVLIDSNQVLPMDYYAGCVISSPYFPTPVTDEFMAKISVTSHRKNGRTLLSAGFRCSCICNGTSGEINFISLLAEYTQKNELKKRKPTFVLGGSIVVAHLCAVKPFCFEIYDENERLGHFTLVHEGTIIGYGNVISVHKPISNKEIHSLSLNWPDSFTYLDTPLMDDLLCLFLIYHISRHSVLQMVPTELMRYIAQNVITVYYLKFYHKT